MLEAKDGRPAGSFFAAIEGNVAWPERSKNMILLSENIVQL